MGQTEVETILLLKVSNYGIAGLNPFFLLRNWLGEAKKLSSPEDAKEFCLDTLVEEISMLQKELSQEHQDIGFCHNDLQYGNIMVDEKTRAITLIVCSLLHYDGFRYHNVLNVV